MVNESVILEIEKERFDHLKRNVMMISELLKKILSKVYTMPSMPIVNGRSKMFHMNNGISAMINGK